jgi:hypothetical protein
VVEKKMMSHLAFTVNGAMCCSFGAAAHDHRIDVRLGQHLLPVLGADVVTATAWFGAARLLTLKDGHHPAVGG